jgi:hypothetical protein
MQLRGVRVNLDSKLSTTVYVQYSAPLSQWLRVFNITEEDFKTEFNGDLFQLTKAINAEVISAPEEE